MPAYKGPLKKLVQYRASGAVTRFHVMRSHRNQTIADHSHGVAMLVMLVEPEPSAVLLKAALTHDFHERDTGDIPSTSKWLYPEIAKAVDAAEIKWNGDNGFNYELTKHEINVLKFCDYMELMVWSWEEVMLGNRYALEPLNNIIRLLDLYARPEGGKALYDALRQEVQPFIEDTK